MIHVWYIVEQGAPGLKQNAPLFQGVKDANALVRGTWGAAPAEGLEPQDGDHVVEKMRMNAFYETRLDILLRGLGVETLIITGAWTNMSIEHTARHAADAGYRAVVASDGTSTMDDEWQSAALELRDAERRLGRDVRRDRGARSAWSRRLDPQDDCLLLVIDLQNDTVGEEGALASSRRGGRSRTSTVSFEKATLLADAFRAGRRASDPRLAHRRARPASTRRGTRRALPARSPTPTRSCAERGAREPVVAAAPREISVVEKQRMSSFNSTTLDTKLRGLGATTVVCCGAWTNWAVELTCRDAADDDYEVVVVNDSTATISEDVPATLRSTTR